MRSHEWHQLNFCVIRASSLVMSLKYNSASHVDYFKWSLIVIPILWIKSENFSVIYVSSIESSNLVNFGTTFLPSLHLWKASLPICDYGISLSGNSFPAMSYLYTVYHMTFQSGSLSLSLPSFFWSGHSHLLAHSSPRLTSYIQYVQSTYVHIICLTPQSFLSGKIGCFPALRMIKSWYWLLNTCLFICFLSYPMSTGFEGGASALSETLMTNEEMLLGWISE